jgi:uncharacterized delta-60 repeat protein
MVGVPGCSESSCEETRTCASRTGGGSGGGIDGGGAGGSTGGTGGWGAGGTGGGAAGTGGISGPGFTVTPKVPSIALKAGSEVVLQVNVKRHTVFDPIWVEAVDLPVGVTSKGSMLQAFDLFVNVTLTAEPSIVPGLTQVKVRGTVGNETQDAALELDLRGLPGTLDSSFGDQGKLTSPLFGDWTRGRAGALAPGNLFYVAGEAGSTAGGSHAYVVARYKGTGQIDASFGTNGVVVRYPNPSTGEHVARGVVVDAQQRPVVAGYFSGNNVFLARFDATGKPDTTFATTGEMGGPAGAFHALALHNDGYVTVGKNDKSPVHALAARAKSDGVADNAFGVASFAVVDTGSFTSEAVAVAIDGDNKIVVAGTTNKPGSPVMVARINPGGTPDSFGTAGVAWLDSGNGGIPTAVAVLPDKQILVAGGAAGDKYFLMQLTQAGAKNTSFGTGGVVSGSGYRIDSMVLDPAGRIVVAGRAGAELRVGRFLSTGAPDTSFSPTGFRDAGAASVTPNAILHSNDERAFVVGTSSATGKDLAWVARLWM